MYEVKQKLKLRMVISNPSKELYNVFFAEILIILGVGTWPNTQVCHFYKQGQLLKIFFLAFVCAYEIFEYT